jgi:hypothetical protein
MKALLGSLVAVLVLLCSTKAFAEDEAKIPEDLAKVMKFYVGNWNLEGSDGDKPLKGKASFRMPTGEHCIVGTVSFRVAGEPMQFSLVSGWDSSTGWSTEQGLAADGTVYTLKWHKAAETVDEGELVGTLDGKAVSEKDRLERKGNNMFVVSCTERQIGDKALPDLTFMYHRVTGEGKKAKAKK